MVKFSDKILACLAYSAEEAFLEALGLASRTGAYEPEMSDELKAYKETYGSKIENFLKK